MDISINVLGLQMSVVSNGFDTVRFFGLMKNQPFCLEIEHHDYWCAFFDPTEFPTVKEWLAVRRRAFIAMYDMIEDYLNNH